ncbi:hypothetical protein [Kutzneria buriramensis]|uniref:Uncharacterized protein n=1 Tax=Kutzneria buriramensis TaxID=1045776 RepID=A0A3E0H132_9PSEU|nr:hypothetical protein [Kutzneria buriramensis]REH35750.1 hypothetical protein BCF44_117138 [Kutzneria buriramensis]
MAERVVLISRSCTTGWADVIHGELWLSAEHLIRRRLGLWQTVANGLWRTVPSSAPQYEITADQILAIQCEHPTNSVVSWSDVVEADLRRGLLCSRLSVVMRSGSRRVFLWFAWDGAFARLEPVVQAIKAARVS